jgi:hypothetical protein
MSRRLALASLALLFVAIALVIHSRRPDSPLAPVPKENPGHFVPSDVALLAATGHPQLVEMFHYG